MLGGAGPEMALRYLLRRGLALVECKHPTS